MRLLLITPGPGRGGCEEYALTMAAAARDAGHAVTACLARSSAFEGLERELGAAGVTSAPWSATHPYRDPFWEPFERQRSAALAAMDASAPDAVLIVLPWPESGTGIAWACAERDVGAVVVFQLAGAGIELTRRERAACAGALGARQRWVAVSAENRAHLAAAFEDPKAIELVTNGVAPARALAPSAVRRTRKQVLGGADAAAELKLVLTVARLEADKAHQDLVAAARILAGRRPDIRFAWAGDGPDSATLARAIDAAGLRDTISLLGYRDDVPVLIQAADAFAFPSGEEGLSFALMEAMAAGSPIIAADASSNGELMRHEVEGLLYPAGDLQALAMAIDRVFREPSRSTEMGHRARLRVLSQFSEQAMIDRTMNLLDAAASAPERSLAQSRMRASSRSEPGKEQLASTSREAVSS
jgi:glycosyltransferase involved in cell wall biosynthesis